MAHGASPASRMGKKLDPYKTAVTLDVLTDYVDFQTYNVWIPGPAFTDLAGSATTINTVGITPVRIFPAGKTNTVGYSFRKPRHWLNGIIMNRPYWTGDDPAGSDAVLSTGVNVREEGGSLSSFGVVAPMTLGLGTITASSLNIIRDFETFDYATPANETYALISVYFRRSGALAGDTYPSDFNLIGVEIYYKEFSSEVSYKIDNNRKSMSRP